MAAAMADVAYGTWVVKAEDDWMCLADMVKKGYFSDIEHLCIDGYAWTANCVKAARRCFSAIHKNLYDLSKLDVIVRFKNVDDVCDQDALAEVGVLTNLTKLSVTLKVHNNMQDEDEDDDDDDDEEWVPAFIIPAKFAKLTKLKKMSVVARFGNYDENNVLVFDDDAFKNLTNLRTLRVRGFGTIGALFLAEMETMPKLDVGNGEVEME
jgi:hypothetical protein